ncbi:MAG: rRNA maturation RNase YbeY [Candidatus Eisenbacteria bacterium]|uniref:Endoribonuclease YbeY n=1 Tax=Eiseniibacteriota bacterium TaxID=2212470 RepID=A0A849SGH7_UNCEI|nr:rRNA maturation RNase YbeY [Candidatus Eisenbacteria bacterium]
MLTPLRTIVRASLAIEGLKPGEIAIVLSDDEELRVLNRRWRGIDRATDVLSFGYDEQPPERGRRVQGDLVISMDRMAEQAKRYRVSPGEELTRLVVHGALHLAGHDHHRLAERRVMRAVEARALRANRGAAKRLDVLLSKARSEKR